MTIEEFIEKCQKRPIPQNPMGKVKTLAKEIAEGNLEDLWEHYISVNTEYVTKNEENTMLLHPNNKNVVMYLEQRWSNDYPSFKSLVAQGYLYQNEKYQFYIQPSTGDLFDEVEDATVFISYKRSESSAFALLVNNTLKQSGIEPFIDMQLEPGDDWHAELEVNIKNSDYFIILLGNKTLNSEVTVKEIRWAIEGNVTLIPIWHNGFEFDTEKWEDLPDEVSQVLSSTHTIRVLEENPLTYDTALRELLNRFGIST